MIDRENAALRILRALRRGRMVFVLNDQYAKRSRGIFAPFFGVRCSTAAGVATIALRTGSPVVPMYVLRDAPDHHTVRVLPPVKVELTGDRKLDIERATAAQNAALEAMIRVCPEQWMWGHRRFRHSPDLPPEPYGPRRSRRHRRTAS